MNIQEFIAIDHEISDGQPVFKGTCVPVESLFDHLEVMVSLDEFLDDFPTVSMEQTVALKPATALKIRLPGVRSI